MINLFSNDLISKNKIRKFIEYFAKEDNWHKMDVKSGNLGYGWVHYGLIRLIRPDRVLCVGSRYGYIPAVCALACKDNGGGVVDFVDAGFDMGDFDGPGKHWGGVGFWKKCDPIKYFGKFGLDGFIKLWVMKSSVYEKSRFKESYGYVHIDGDHSYEGVKSDFDLFWPKVKKGGFLAIHDIGSPDKNGNVYGTRKFWKEVKTKYKVSMEFVEDPGLGVLQKI